METGLKILTIKQIQEAVKTIVSNINKKANLSTTLYGYGINDAYLKSEFDGKIDTAFAGKTSIEKLEEYQTLKNEMADNNYKVPVDEVGLKVVDGMLCAIIDKEAG